MTARHDRPAFLPLLSLVLLLSAPPARGSAADYLPLVSGQRWEFGRLLGETATIEVQGTVDVLGATTTLLRWSEVGQSYENFWSHDSQGRTWLHGARNLTFAFEAAYTPPILFLNPPMPEGATWTTPDVVVTDLSGGTPSAPIDMTFGAGFVGALTVPAGTFPAVGIGELSPAVGPLAAAGFDRLGARRTGTGTNPASVLPRFWFSDGLGPVQYLPDFGDPYRLLRYSGPTPVALTTWSRIKLLVAR